MPPACRMFGEDTARAAERAGQRVGDRPEDEAPRRELREIGEQRGDEVAEVQLAGLHELADGVLGRLEGADEALADIAADLARLAGVVRQRRRDRLPAGDGGLGRRAPPRQPQPRPRAGARRRASGIVQRGAQIGRLQSVGIIQRRFATPPRCPRRRPSAHPRPPAAGSRHRSACLPPRGSRRPGRGHPRPPHQDQGRAHRHSCAPVPRKTRPPLQRPPPRLRRRTGCRSRPSATGSSVPIRTPPSPVAQFGKQVQRAIQRRDEAVDPGDDAVQHRLDAADQPVRRLEGEVADGAGETPQIAFIASNAP